MLYHLFAVTFGMRHPKILSCTKPCNQKCKIHIFAALKALGENVYNFELDLFNFNFCSLAVNYPRS